MMKQVSFKPEMKEWTSERWWMWRNCDGILNWGVKYYKKWRKKFAISTSISLYRGVLFKNTLHTRSSLIMETAKRVSVGDLQTLKANTHCHIIKLYAMMRETYIVRPSLHPRMRLDNAFGRICHSLYIGLSDCSRRG